MRKIVAVGGGLEPILLDFHQTVFLPHKLLLSKGFPLMDFQENIKRFKETWPPIRPPG
jgi:hypothetical protein